MCAAKSSSAMAPLSPPERVRTDTAPVIAKVLDALKEQLGVTLR